MNANLYKRLFRAIGDSADEDLILLASSILEDERQKGHALLAQQLEDILNKYKILAVNNNPERKLSVLGSLPTDKRYQQPLVTVLSQELLRHHIVLPDEIELRFQRIEKEYAARDRLARYGLFPRQKILLYGPPGCGKSLGAERMAWRTGLPLLKVRFDAIISSYFGESAANLRSVFDSATDSPCLLFLDECDFVAKSRNLKNDVGEVPRIVNTLLQLLEEYKAPGLLVAATNLDHALDKAIFRRFDDVFELPLPGPSEIRQLLKMTLSSIEIDPYVSWDDLVDALKGYSAAQVVKVAQDAAKTAILSDNLPVNQSNLQSAILEIRKTE